MDKKEFEFPNPEDERENGEVEVEIDGEDEIEVVDDTPPEDRNRAKSPAEPEEVSEEELGKYSEKVQNRIRQFTRGYHDERRAKEQALREREAAANYARTLQEKVKILEGTVGKNQQTLLEQAKRTVQLEVEKAKKAYRDAYEAGDTDAVIAAQEQLTKANIRADRVNNFKVPPIQNRQNGVQTPQQRPVQPQAPVEDKKAQQWAKENTWFGADDEMTSFALGLHTKLTKQGVDPRSDEYYEKVNARMRQVFPESFADVRKTQTREVQKRPPTVVAPATRSVGTKKFVLTKSEVAVARKLNVPLDEYARQVAALRKQDNG